MISINPTEETLVKEISRLATFFNKKTLIFAKENNKRKQATFNIEHYKYYGGTFICLDTPDRGLLSLVTIYPASVYTNEHNEKCLMTEKGFHVNVDQYYKDEWKALQTVIEILDKESV